MIDFGVSTSWLARSSWHVLCMSELLVGVRRIVNSSFCSLSETWLTETDTGREWRLLNEMSLSGWLRSDIDLLALRVNDLEMQVGVILLLHLTSSIHVTISLCKTLDGHCCGSWVLVWWNGKSMTSSDRLVIAVDLVLLSIYLRCWHLESRNFVRFSVGFHGSKVLTILFISCWNLDKSLRWTIYALFVKSVINLLSL